MSVVKGTGVTTRQKVQSLADEGRPRCRWDSGGYAVAMSYDFPVARKLAQFARRARQNWLARHRNAFNFWIHMVGIPLAVAGLPMLFVAEWYWGMGAIVGGYALQWGGHLVEGNDVGELIPVKRLLGLPVVAVAPGHEADTSAAP